MNSTSVLSRLCVLALAAAMGSSFLACEKKEKAKDDDTAKEDKSDSDDDKKKADDDDDDDDKKKADDDDDDDDKKKKKADDDDDDDDDTASADDDDDDDEGKEEPEDEEDPLADLGAEDTVEVVQYADMTPVTGTVRLKERFTVKNDIIPEAKTLTNLAPGTLVDLKGNHKNFMLIDWPSGVGEMAPGWIDVANVSDKRIAKVESQQAIEAKKKQEAKLKAQEAARAKREADRAALAKKEGKKPPPTKKKGRPKIILRATGGK